MSVLFRLITKSTSDSFRLAVSNETIVSIESTTDYFISRSGHVRYVKHNYLNSRVDSSYSRPVHICLSTMMFENKLWIADSRWFKDEMKCFMQVTSLSSIVDMTKKHQKI